MDKKKIIKEILFHDYGRVDETTVDKLCVLFNVGKRIFLVFEYRENIDKDREILKAFNKESEAVLWIANKNPKKYYYEMHKIG